MAPVQRGYDVGAIVLDASFLPQSRPRVFVIAVNVGIVFENLIGLDRVGCTTNSETGKVLPGGYGGIQKPSKRRLT